MSAVAVVIAWNSIPERRLSLVILGICAMVWLVTAGLLWRSSFTFFRRVGQGTLRWATAPQSGIRAGGNRALDKLDEMHLVLRTMFTCPGAVVKVCVLAVVMLLVRVMCVDLLFRCLGVVVPVEYELAFMPMIMLLIVVPISIGGIGINEGAFVYLFGVVGVDAAVALGVPLIGYVVTLAVLVGVGGVFMLADPALRRKVDSVS